VIFKKPCHADVAVTVSKKVGAGYMVLGVLGGLLPVVIDTATGPGTCSAPTPFMACSTRRPASCPVT